jgi:Mg2+/Co2+ transporter CorC
MSGRPREGFSTVQELILSVEFLKVSQRFVARVVSEAGGTREYNAASPEDIIEQVVEDLREEFESAPAY